MHLLYLFVDKGIVNNLFFAKLMLSKLSFFYDFIDKNVISNSWTRRISGIAVFKLLERQIINCLFILILIYVYLFIIRYYQHLS